MDVAELDSRQNSKGEQMAVSVKVRLQPAEVLGKHAPVELLEEDLGSRRRCGSWMDLDMQFGW